MTATTHTPTSVYRYYDADGRLIYVGITSRGMLRQNEHNAHAPWWRYVRSQDVEHHDTREAALARETWLIQRHRPPFNRAQNPDADERRRAYLEQHGQAEDRCGHCTGCTLDGTDGKRFPCRRMRATLPDDDSIECPICGSRTCIYGDGHHEGYHQGVLDGFLDGREAGWRAARLAPQYLADLALRSVVDGLPSHDVEHLTECVSFAAYARDWVETRVAQDGALVWADLAAEVL